VKLRKKHAFIVSIDIIVPILHSPFTTKKFKSQYKFSKVRP
jgi:hypothetical protein